MPHAAGLSCNRVRLLGKSAAVRLERFTADLSLWGIGRPQVMIDLQPSSNESCNTWWMRRTPLPLCCSLIQTPALLSSDVMNDVWANLGGGITFAEQRQSACFNISNVDLEALIINRFTDGGQKSRWLVCLLLFLKLISSASRTSNSIKHELINISPGSLLGRSNVGFNLQSVSQSHPGCDGPCTTGCSSSSSSSKRAPSILPLHALIDPGCLDPAANHSSLPSPGTTPITRPLTRHTNVIRRSQMLLGAAGGGGWGGGGEDFKKVNSQRMTHIRAALPRTLSEDTAAGSAGGEGRGVEGRGVRWMWGGG